MIRITRFSAKNYRGFTDLQMTRLRPTNLLYGQNNSGKSSILKLISLIFQEKASSVAQQAGFESGNVEAPFIFTNNDRSKPVEFEVVLDVSKERLASRDEHLAALIHGKTAEIHSVKLLGTFKSENFYQTKMELNEIHLDAWKVFYRDASMQPRFLNDETGFRIYSGLLRSLAGSVAMIDSNRSASGTSILPHDFNRTNLERNLLSLSLDAEQRQRYVTFLEFVKQFGQSLKGEVDVFADFDIHFGQKDGISQIMITNTHGTSLPLGDLGTGITQILLILTQLFFHPARIVLLEELELNLSPQLQPTLLRYIQKLMSNKKIDQFICTTHSGHFVHWSDCSVYWVATSKGVSKLEKGQLAAIKLFSNPKDKK